MRNGWVSGLGAAGGTMLLLVAAVMIAQPNVRVLDGAFSGWLGGGDEPPPAEARVEEVVVEPGRVSGRVRNTSAVGLGSVEVTVRLGLAGGGARTERVSVYALAPGAEAWFGIPLVGGPAAVSADVVEVRATAGTGKTAPSGATSPRSPRRGGAGGMQDVERFEREMKQMEEATRSVTGR